MERAVSGSRQPVTGLFEAGQDVRVVLIGFGGMGRQYAEILAGGQAPGLILQGICCRNAEGQALIREQYPQTAIYRDTDDVFAHRDDFDAVVIATPHMTHVEIGKQALAAGKHVFCEKPVGVTSREVGELLAARQADTALAVMFNNRALPAFWKAKELLEDHAIGQVTRAVWVCNNWFRSPVYHKSAPWRSSWRKEGGGLLINQCQHYLDIWQWLFGMPDAVDADLDFGKYNDFSVDDGADIRFLYRKKGDSPAMRGSFISASGEHPGVNRLEIWGTGGKLTIDQGKSLVFDRNLVDIRQFNKENTEIYRQPEHREEEVALTEEKTPYVTMFQNFSSHLHTGEPLIAEGKDGLNAILLTNAAYLSAWTGEHVEFPMDEKRYEKMLAQRAREED